MKVEQLYSTVFNVVARDICVVRRYNMTRSHTTRPRRRESDQERK